MALRATIMDKNQQQEEQQNNLGEVSPSEPLLLATSKKRKLPTNTKEADIFPTRSSTSICEYSKKDNVSPVLKKCKPIYNEIGNRKIKKHIPAAVNRFDQNLPKNTASKLPPHVHQQQKQQGQPVPQFQQQQIHEVQSKLLKTSPQIIQQPQPNFQQPSKLLSQLTSTKPLHALKQDAHTRPS